MSFVYTRLLAELYDQWRIEYQAVMTGWHVAMAFSDGTETQRPQVPSWTDVRQVFDDWLASTPDAGMADELPPEKLDLMIAMGWRE